MDNMEKWDPFRDLLGVQNDMTKLFDRALNTGPSSTARAWAPPLDICETPEGYRVVAELPGFGPSDVDLTVDNGTLTIRGERKFYTEVSPDSFHRVERKFGAFMRSVSLPSQVEAEKISAAFDKGVLTIDIPKAEIAKPRRIEVKASGA
ncbi:MAG: Hsp20/alpha crystallin family protein [Actinomycetota bacterium]